MWGVEDVTIISPHEPSNDELRHQTMLADDCDRGCSDWDLNIAAYAATYFRCFPKGVRLIAFLPQWLGPGTTRTLRESRVLTGIDVDFCVQYHRQIPLLYCVRQVSMIARSNLVHLMSVIPLSSSDGVRSFVPTLVGVSCGYVVDLA